MQKNQDQTWSQKKMLYINHKGMEMLLGGSVWGSQISASPTQYCHLCEFEGEQGIK